MAFSTASETQPQYWMSPVSSIEAERKLIVRRAYLKTVVFKRKVMGGWESTEIFRLDLKKVWRQQRRNFHLKLSSRAL